MKKLLFINGNMSAGGVERSLADLLKHLDYSKYEVDLLLLERVDGYADELPKEVNVILKDLTLTDGKLVSCLGSSIKAHNKYSFLVRLYMAFPKVFKLSGMEKVFSTGQKYDVVIAYRTGICSEIALNCFSAKKKILWWHHGDVSNVPNDFALKILPFDKIVSVSQSMKKILCKAFSLNEEKIFVVPNMVDEKEVKRKSLLPYVSQRKENCLNLLSVGRFSAEKNYIICPEICKKLKEKNIKVNWIMIGDGTQWQAVKDKAESLGVKDDFKFIGAKSNPYVYYNDADIFVHPSVVESQCISILETMALGVPVVAVKSAGPAEYMVNGKNGVIEENNSDILAQKISQLFYDKQQKENFVVQGKKTAIEFSVENTLEKFTQLVEEI